jgi:hypothetical protein
MFFAESSRYPVLSTAKQTSATQVFVRCTYCNASVIPSKVLRGNVSTRVRSAASRNPTRRTTMACSSCRRPLPRCSVCLLQLGTATKGGASTKHAGGDPAGKVQRLGWWISWCQRCRHGGHAEHLEAWFRDHDACPVSGCICNCSLSHNPALPAPAQPSK